MGESRLLKYRPGRFGSCLEDDRMKKFLYWLVQLTWGGLLTIPGLLITGFCILFLKGTPHKNGYSYIVEIGGNWGGLEIGAVALCGRYSENDPAWYEHTRRHEFGHSIQQLIFGPFQMFIVGIPSACRYWYRRLTPNKSHRPYDYAIFEYTASKWGYTWVNRIEKVEKEYTYKRD